MDTNQEGLNISSLWVIGSGGGGLEWELEGGRKTERELS